MHAAARGGRRAACVLLACAARRGAVSVAERAACALRAACCCLLPAPAVVVAGCPLRRRRGGALCISLCLLLVPLPTPPLTPRRRTVAPITYACARRLASALLSSPPSPARAAPSSPPKHLVAQPSLRSPPLRAPALSRALRCAWPTLRASHTTHLLTLTDHHRPVSAAARRQHNSHTHYHRPLSTLAHHGSPCRRQVSHAPIGLSRDHRRQPRSTAVHHSESTGSRHGMCKAATPRSGPLLGAAGCAAAGVFGTASGRQLPAQTLCETHVAAWQARHMRCLSPTRSLPRPSHAAQRPFRAARSARALDALWHGGWRSQPAARRSHDRRFVEVQEATAHSHARACPECAVPCSTSQSEWSPGAAPCAARNGAHEPAPARCTASHLLAVAGTAVRLLRCVDVLSFAAMRSGAAAAALLGLGRAARCPLRCIADNLTTLSSPFSHFSFCRVSTHACRMTTPRID
jgi:hypothetical protein